MSTIKLNELAESDINLTDLIAKSDTNGLMTRTNIQKLVNYIGAISTSGMKAAIESTSAAPTEDGLYPCTESGTYTNFGGEVVDISGQVVFISVSDTQTVFDKIVIPLNITFDNEPTDGSTNAVESGGVKSSLDLKENANIVKTTPTYTFIGDGSGSATINTSITLVVGDVIKLNLQGNANIKYNVQSRTTDPTYPTLASNLTSNTDYEIEITDTILGGDKTVDLFGIKESSSNTVSGTGILTLEVYNNTSKKIYQEKIKVDANTNDITTNETDITNIGTRIDGIEGASRTNETIYNNALTQTKNIFLLKGVDVSNDVAIEYGKFIKEFYVKDYPYDLYVSAIKNNVSGDYRLTLKSEINGVWTTALFIDETTKPEYINETYGGYDFYIVFDWNTLTDGANFFKADNDLITDSFKLLNVIGNLDYNPTINKKVTSPEDTGFFTKNINLEVTPKEENNLARLQEINQANQDLENVNNSFSSLLRNIYEQRVDSDSENILNEEYLLGLIKFHSKNDTYNGTRFLFDANLGNEVVSDGLNSLCAKLYNLISNKDASQSTALNQANILGFIDKLDKHSLKKDELTVKSLSHSDIIFDLTKSSTKFCVTTLIKNYGTPTGNKGYYAGGFEKSIISISNADGIRIKADTGSQQIISEGDIELKAFGKYTVITLLFDGLDNTFSTFMNGSHIKTSTSTTGDIFTLNEILKANYHDKFNGELIYHRIHKGDISYNQITNEQIFLKQYFNDFKTTGINGENVVVENLNITQTPNLTLIPNESDSVNWAALSTPAWCYYDNDNDIGVWSGKLYNGYAKDTLISDINEYGGYGYHVMSLSDANILISEGGYDLKVSGSVYWNTDTGTNETGFSAVGSGYRLADGTFGGTKDIADYWIADTDQVLRLNHSDNTATIVSVTKNYGASIRLFKDNESIDFSLPAIAEFGFEETSVLSYETGSNYFKEFFGIDSRYSSNNNWANLKDASNIAKVQIQLGSNLTTDNYAEIIDNPYGTGRVLHYNLKNTQGDDIDGQQMDRGRVQMTVSKDAGYDKIRTKQKVYFGDGFNYIKNYPDKIDWLTLLEVWNQPSWTQDPYPFRIKLNIFKAKGSDRLFFNILSDRGSGALLMDVKNYDYEVPLQEWLDFEFYVKDGGLGDGEVVFKCNDIEIFNLTTFTRDPLNLTSSKIPTIHPLKLYTSKELVDYIASINKSLDVYFDNWRMYIN